LGWKFDYKKIDAELEKMRKTLNLTNVPDTLVFDPESATDEQKKQHDAHMQAIDKVNEGLQDEVKKLHKTLEIELRDVSGEYKDEVSLLN
jgi:uncharacterized FlaG/YvyC family protein